MSLVSQVQQMQQEVPTSCFRWACGFWGTFRKENKQIRKKLSLSLPCSCCILGALNSRYLADYQTSSRGGQKVLKLLLFLHVSLNPEAHQGGGNTSSDLLTKSGRCFQTVMGQNIGEAQCPQVFLWHTEKESTDCKGHYFESLVADPLFAAD